MTKRQSYRCELIAIVPLGGFYRLQVRMLEDHKGAGGLKGQDTITSNVKSIDFERGIAITKNSIYHWAPERES